MSNLKHKIGYRVMAFLMAVLMIVSLIPTTAIANDGDMENDPFKAKSFTATYDAETDAVDMEWEAFETAPHELWVCMGGNKIAQVDVEETDYTIATPEIGNNEYSLLAYVDEEDTEGVESERVSVLVASTFASIQPLEAISVDNDLSITEIVKSLPDKVVVNIKENSDTFESTVVWNTESITYDQSISDEQTITVPGIVSLDTSKVQNRENLPLDCAIEVTVKAAEDVVITLDLDDSTVIEKKVAESVTFSIEATGTAPTYQWYVKADEAVEGTKIEDATSNEYTISSLMLADSSKYYCVVTGKNGVIATSKEASLNVSKNTTSVDLSIDPEGGQTRPQGIKLEAVGVPEDATGEVIFKEGDNVLETITLPSNDISTTFVAYGAKNDYDFTVIYDAGEDNDKYLGSEKTISGYGFNKAEQTVKFELDTIPNEAITYSENASFTVQATGSKTNLSTKYEYSIVDEKDADGLTVSDFVASVNKETGEVKVLAAGTFKISVKALSDDDYNESPVVKTEEITVNRAEQGEFTFESGEAETTYTHNFEYTRDLASTGTGIGEVTYKLGATTTAEGVVVDSKTGAITFSDAVNDNSSEFKGEVGVVEVVATKDKDKWWKAKSTSYTITIKKAEQSLFEFADLNPEDITYTANNGTEYTNIISNDDNKNGWVNVKNNPVYSIDKQEDLSRKVVSDVVSIDSTTGKITAKRSGIVTIKATLAGNGVYESVEATYVITINRGTVETAENGTNADGFKFDKSNSDIKYGFVGFTNAASGGQDDTNKTIIYAVDNSEVSVSDNGVISFVKNPAEAAQEEYVVIVTATKPETEKYNECTVSYKLTVTRDAVDPITDFKVNGNVIKDAAELTSLDGWYNAEHEKITITPSGNYVAISEDGNNWFSSIERTEDDKHSIAFYLKEECGNTTLISNQVVNYDKTFPTAKLTVEEDFWDEFWETITFGIWKNESKQVLIEADDNLSGIMSIEYYEQNSEFQEVTEETSIEKIVKDFTWEKCEIEQNDLKASATISVNLAELTNKKVVVYAKVTDYAGNVSYFRTNGMVFDNVTPKQETELPNPIINIELDENVNEGLYNGEVPFTLTVNDNQTNAVASGIKNIKVTITGSDKEEYEKIINIAATKSEIDSFDSKNVNANEFTVDNDFVVPAEFDSNHLTILVEVEDYAGNKYTNKDQITHLAIDVTDPEIKVIYNDGVDTFSNDKYIGNNKNRIATIDITELNFDNSGVVITVTQDEKQLDIKPTFTAIEGAVDENGDQIGWRMNIDYATLGEGEFTFDVAYTDKATNTNKGWDGDDVAVNKNFIIDNTKPVISVVISNSDVQNGKYFAADRTATVTIIERNFSADYRFDWSGLTLALDGQALSAPTPTITKSDDNTYERVYTINFSAEGDYTFDVKYTDLADNLADTYACSSVSYKEFTVDKTAPVLDITGVGDKSANNGDVAPVITYSDVNFKKDTVSIVLTGVNNGKVDYAGSYADATHGQTFTYANFEKLQAVDDIYTLTVRLTDMAGNSTEKTISFSANRFGSVYNINELKNIISKYLNAEEDIVFTETNVDALEREGIKIKLTKNGTPTDLVEGRDYTVEVTGGNGQWSVFKYIIKKALFADDGRYSVSIYSKDAAGNINENIDETKKAEISFGIDKTNPVVVPIDLESGVQYAVDMKTVSVEIKDNLVLEDVKIYLNGEEVEYKVDGETYTFDIKKNNSKQTVKIVAVDAAGNEEPVEITDFLVNANIFVRWYNNTPLFVGSIIGVVVLAIGITTFIVFGKKKKG